MEALREHRIRKKRQKCMLSWANFLVYAMIGASMVVSLSQPLINVYLFFFVMSGTWIMDMICIRRIQSHMKRIGTMLPNKSSVVIT